MFPRRDPNLVSQYLCRFCGERIRWGVIVRVLRVDPDTPGFMLNDPPRDGEVADAAGG